MFHQVLPYANYDPTDAFSPKNVARELEGDFKQNENTDEQHNTICFLSTTYCINKWKKEKGIVPKIMTDDLAKYKKYISPNYLNGNYNVKKTIDSNYNTNTDFRKDCDEEYKKYKDIFKISGDISRKTYCNIITNTHIGKSSKDYFVDFMRQRNGAKVMCYQQKVKEWSWCDEPDYLEQIKVFKKHIKSGRMKVNEFNNNEHDLNGVKWYSMCFQQYDDNGDLCGNMDIGSMEVFSYHIAGYVYYYKNKTDRDNMFSHLNKYQN